MFSIFLGASASTLLMNQSHLFKEFTSCQWRKIFSLYNTHIFFSLVWVCKRGSYGFFSCSLASSFCFCFLWFLQLWCYWILLNYSFTLCIGEGGFFFLFILCRGNQGVPDKFSAALRISLNLGDVFKLLLSDSGFTFLLPFSVFQWDMGFAIFFYPLNSPFTSTPPPSASINWVRVKVTDKSASVNGCIWTDEHREWAPALYSSQFQLALDRAS